MIMWVIGIMALILIGQGESFFILAFILGSLPALFASMYILYRIFIVILITPIQRYLQRRHFERRNYPPLLSPVHLHGNNAASTAHAQQQCRNVVEEH